MTGSRRMDLNKDPKEAVSMFGPLASQYGVMDALMAGGLDRAWMTVLHKAVAPHPGERILDPAASTDASSAVLAKDGTEVVAYDLSEGMIGVGHECHPEIELAHGNTIDLDFEDGSLDTVAVSQDLRNIPDPELALREMARVVRPRGRLVALKLSAPPPRVFHGMYSAYQPTVMPAITRLVSTNGGAYDYLVGSIRAWPAQEGLGRTITTNGWSEVEYRNLIDGIACIRCTVRPLP